MHLPAFPAFVSCSQESLETHVLGRGQGLLLLWYFQFLPLLLCFCFILLPGCCTSSSFLISANICSAYGQWKVCWLLRLMASEVEQCPRQSVPLISRNCNGFRVCELLEGKYSWVQCRRVHAKYFRAAFSYKLYQKLALKIVIWFFPAVSWEKVISLWAVWAEIRFYHEVLGGLA